MDEFEELREDFRDKEQRRMKRALQSKWEKIRPVGKTVLCRWIEPPIQGQEATAEVLIGEDTMRHTVGIQVRTDQDGRTAFDPFVKRFGYEKAVEKWALWKWHTARGTPVDERDNYQVEPNFTPPTFEWEKIVAHAE